MDSTVLIVIILLVLLMGGGGGYYGTRSGWGGPHYGGGLLGIVVLVLAVLWLTGNLNLSRRTVRIGSRAVVPSSSTRLARNATPPAGVFAPLTRTSAHRVGSAT